VAFVAALEEEKEEENNKLKKHKVKEKNVSFLFCMPLLQNSRT
jgi:hypothetical protein